LYKKEYLYVFLIVTAVCVFAAVVVNRSPDIIMEYPDERVVFQQEDFIINTYNGDFTVGKTSWDDALKVFPDGSQLGLSTIYHPEGLNLYLTFSEDENILIAAHIESPAIFTSRGIEIGDSFEQAVQVYGKNYIHIQRTESEENTFDALYGRNDGNTIIFQVKENAISKIILQHNP